LSACTLITGDSDLGFRAGKQISVPVSGMPMRWSICLQTHAGTRSQASFRPSCADVEMANDSKPQRVPHDHLGRLCRLSQADTTHGKDYQPRPPSIPYQMMLLHAITTPERTRWLTGQKTFCGSDAVFAHSRVVVPWHPRLIMLAWIAVWIHTFSKAEKWRHHHLRGPDIQLGHQSADDIGIFLGQIR
jgi:hypothetical protein